MPTPFRTVRIPCIESLPLRPRWLDVRVHTDTGLTGPGEATLAEW
jgi:L-alanine-DL-glutamate epimerase-like enolase superfamily enzyme